MIDGGPGDSAIRKPADRPFPRHPRHHAHLQPSKPLHAKAWVHAVRRAKCASRQKLGTAADSTGITRYRVKLGTYQLLRYGVPVQGAAGQAHETVQLALAGNTSQGLRYGTTATPEQFFWLKTGLPPVTASQKQIGNKTPRPPLPRPIKYQAGPLCIATLSCHGRADPELC